MKILPRHISSLRIRSICLVLLLCVGALPGCKDKRATKSDINDNYSNVSAEDAAMNAAITKAKETMPQFLAALRNKKASQSDFAVKKPYATPSGGNEHMWIADVREVNGVLEGVIANEAVDTKLVSLGQHVKLQPSEISDWKYVDDGYLIGGYTIRYFFDRMSAEEKQELEQQAGFKIR